MEFHEKLQELRKQRGLTQEELAQRLYVSRTAISKWESGRGYPNIESLKAIAAFFSMTVDALLSSDEVLTLAEKSQRQTKSHARDLVFGLLDLCAILLLFLPLFAGRGESGVHAVSLLSLNGGKPYLQIAYFAVVIGMSVMGILTLALQACTAAAWTKIKTPISLGLGAVAVLLLVISLQPYAAVFSLALLAVKTALLILQR